MGTCHSDFVLMTFCTDPASTEHSSPTSPNDSVDVCVWCAGCGGMCQLGADTAITLQLEV